MRTKPDHGTLLVTSRRATAIGTGTGIAATTAGVGAGSLPEMAGDTPESPPEFTWPLEAFADACPFVVELVLSADEAACTEPDGVL